MWRFMGEMFFLFYTVRRRTTLPEKNIPNFGKMKCCCVFSGCVVCVLAIV
jgi:hypothetical protein